MTYTSKKERGTSARSSLLTLIVVMLVGLFTVGCGDSGEDFVVTGNNGNAVPTGNVTFQFAKAQNIATVPTATTRLIFEFLDAAGARTGNGADVEFANSVTLSVPTSAARAVVRAINAQGATIATVNFTFTVLANQTVTAVVAGGGTTGTTTGNTTGSTTGNTTGSTTGNTTGSTTGNTTGTTTGNTTGGTPARIEVTPASLSVAANTAAAATNPFQVRFFPANSTSGTVVPANTIQVTFSGANPAGTENRYSYTPTSGVLATNVAGGTAVGNTVNGTVSVTINGQSASQVVPITNVSAAEAGAIVSTEIISIKGGNTGSLSLPKGMQYPFIAVNVAANGTRSNAVWGAGANQLSFDATTTAAVGTGSAAGNLTLGNAAASGTVVVRRANATATGFINVSANPVTVLDTTLNPTAGTNNVKLTLSANAVKVGALLPYRVNLILTGGTEGQDITPLATVTSSAANATVNVDATNGAIRTGNITGVTTGSSNIDVTGVNAALTSPTAFSTGTPSQLTPITITP